MPNKRIPIVTVLGHTDHGKTTLLDAVRKTNVTAREAGGITQSIGASIVETKEGKKITFIDTPGHAAFSGMRSRGARLADIAVLVVAADDGVMPQTKEAIGFIREADIPFVVAITKIDLPNANIQSALASLEAEGIYFEGRGGDTSYVEVSAREGRGVEKLLDLIILVSEVHDILADPEGELEGIVIETGKDNRGALASVIVRNGTLMVGNEIGAEGQTAKVRGIFNYQKKSVKKILPGEPGLILGFSSIPPVGSVIKKAGERKTKKLEGDRFTTKGKMKEGQIPFIFKAQNAGALEALAGGLPSEVFTVSKGVGDISENDVFLAKTSKAKIFAFDIKVLNRIARLAETEKVEIKSFKVIYELFEEIDKIIKAGIKVITARAEVIASFPFNSKKVAGCRLVAGKISKGNKLILTREDKDIGEARAASLRRGKEELMEVAEGEFGVILEPQLDFIIGDVLISRQ